MIISISQVRKLNIEILSNLLKVIQLKIVLWSYTIKVWILILWFPNLSSLLPFFATWRAGTNGIAGWGSTFTCLWVNAVALSSS